MKNSINLIVAFAFIFMGSNMVFSQDRNVYWLHGMNGDNSHWLRYSLRFENDRYMDSYRKNFPSSGHIDEIAQGVANSILSIDSRNIGIGHSLGGVVCRDMETLGGNEFGGVITVHSPNMGASLAHSVNDGSAEAFLNHVSSVFVTALEGINEHLNLEISFIDVLVGDLIGVLNVAAFPIAWIFGKTDPLIPYTGIEGQIPSEEYVESSITDGFSLLNDPELSGIIDDLDATTGFMSNLNSFPTTKPRIEVHGYEEDHEFMRLACSSEEEVWKNALTTDSAYPDNCKVNEFKRIRHSLWLAKSSLIAKATLSFGNIFNPFKTEKYIDLWNTVGDVEDARALLDGDLEEAWGDLIGTQWVPTTTTQTVMSASCQSQLDNAYSQLAYLNQQLAQCQAQPNPSCGSILSVISIVQNQIASLQTSASCMVTVTNTTYVPLDNSEAPSDGFILESEMTTGALNVVGTYQNKKVNHMEVLNHPEMWKNFNAIFNRTGTDFFRTDPR